MGKRVFNYKKALNAPYLIQKLWKGFSLENPIKAEKLVVIFGTFVFLLTFGRPLMNFLGMIKGVDWAAYVLIPLGVMLAWDKANPDELKITQYVLDMVVYLVTYYFGKKKICNDEIITNKFDVVVFEKIED